MPGSQYYTAEMVRALHQRVQLRLLLALGNYLRDQSVGELYASPADISWTADTLVQPDLFVVELMEARTLDWSRMKTLLLAVEVLSPSSPRADRFTKRRLYQEQRIPLYWVVDCDDQSVEVWTPEALFPVVERARVTWQPAGASESCGIDLAEVFAPS